MGWARCISARPKGALHASASHRLVASITQPGWVAMRVSPGPKTDA